MNSFGVEATAHSLFEFEGADDLKWFFDRPETASCSWYVWSGGNNILLGGDYPGTLLHPVSGQIRLLSGDSRDVLVEAGAGVEWDDLVAWCVERGWGGIENLSLIPGYVGAAPVQNIGAYGVELKDVFHSAAVFLPETGEVVEMTAEACRFGYRDSIFKQELRHRAIILSVVLRLSGYSEFRLDYGDLGREVEALGGPTLRNIRRAVIAIRERKLPDPRKLGNAGSFFKNPVVSQRQGVELQEMYAGMPVYGAGPDRVKLAAGWLIDRAGWKGVRRGAVGVHERQALVLVNYGGATGAEIISLADEIRRSVRERFGVEIEPEVNVLA